MTRIFLDPGHGGSDPGAVGNGLQEKNLTLSIATRVRDILLNEYQGVEVRMSRTTDVFIGLDQRTQQANAWNANYFMSIHINAGGGTGFESFVHTNASAESVRLQGIIHPAIIQQMNVTNRGLKRANFAVLRTSNMPAILTENLFIDRAADADLLRSPAYLDRIARGHANGLAQAFNLQRRGGGGGTIYRVQAGAFSVRANADQQQARLRGDGYESIIVQSGSLFLVQVGAFSIRANAEALASELRGRGYDVAVVSG
ncbi:N-acetylmuramoyl-L-alanine amidase [Alkalihalobacillus xiaoxiensis]|uniref:N-acetylmuramoyl-L-alanine amidase n=1 Tax=Shouchella xiaoxiensis TaxID=766895 RepID=A0ABS2SVS6_9BACI|nr:N-acetylmuramoyl-L-alanine amidase [Shouchella xiaoxiensis]MBM7839608.1 N-acetylmuramoyl-L-alanine amidase [Shouchella xiaoxiensis]